MDPASATREGRRLPIEAMSIDTGASMKSSSRSRRPGSSRFPPRVLFNTTAVVGVRSNRTAATCRTRNGLPIQVSFLFKRPPQPSTLFLFCSDLNVSVDPEIVCSVDDLLLIRVNMGWRRFDISPDDCDYFVYRASYRRPSLELLQRPHPFFHNCDVGLLPRSNGYYTIAALLSTDQSSMFEIHLFHSDTSTWTSTVVSETSQTQCPQGIPRCGSRLLPHHTTTVITIGGQGGTIGWVDLWRGILFCEVLDPKPVLRFVPLPSPLGELTRENLWGEGLGYSGHRRGISFIKDKGYLKFVHMEVTGNHVPNKDEDTAGSSTFRSNDWTLTTWSNKRMSSLLDDWRKDCMVRASNITIDGRAVSQVLDSGLLNAPRGDEVAAELIDLKNLSTYQPTPCASGADVVYLATRLKFRHPKAWILAVEMKGTGRLQGVGYCGNQQHRFLGTVYCPSRISKYLHRKKAKDLATTSGAVELEGANTEADDDEFF